MNREREFLAAIRRSRAFLRRWAVPPVTSRAFRSYVLRLSTSTHQGYFVVLRASGELVGVVNLNEIVRGSFQAAYLGCYAFLPHVGRGYMSEGLRLVLRRAFGELRLHRLEANIQPENKSSLAFFRRLGLRRARIGRATRLRNGTVSVMRVRPAESGHSASGRPEERDLAARRNAASG